MRTVDPETVVDDRAQNGQDATVVVSLDELAFLSNAITESLMAVESWEFDSRLGKTPDQARALRSQISSILDHLDTVRRS